jgi:rubrerythrin
MSDLQKSLEALKLALKTEEEGYNLYRMGAEQTGNELVKSIFHQLFKDELMHMDLIKRFYAQLNNSANWGEILPSDKDYKGIKGEMKTIFSEQLNKLKGDNPQFTDNDIQVYLQAIDFEKKGVIMYDRFVKETDDMKAKQFYSFLRDMEQDHADVLDNTYQYLKNPESWYLRQEGWTLDD